MRVLSYVGSILTVISDKGLSIGQGVKPEFIIGDNFYYEPMIKMCDGIPLTPEQEQLANTFIDNFVFETITPVIDVFAHCVDTDGNYLGYIVNDNNYREVIIDVTDDLTNKYFDGTGFIDGVLIDKTTSMYIGVGDTRTSINAKYAPNTIGETPFSLERYKYDEISNTWSITLESAKECKKAGLKQKHTEEVNALISGTGSFEVSSFITQEQEAKSWLIDNDNPTPFIDSLLLHRNFGETKLELVDKIIAKSTFYTVAYSALLGKYHNLIKLTDSCKTIDEIKLIIW